MSHSVLVESARMFIADFYRELLHGKRVGQAMLAGQRALMATTSGAGVSTARCISTTGLCRCSSGGAGPGADPRGARRSRSVGIAARGRTALGELPEPHASVPGRSRDLLKAERVLAGERYLAARGRAAKARRRLRRNWRAGWWRRAGSRGAVFTSVETDHGAAPGLFSVGGQLVSNSEPRGHGRCARA